VKNENLCNKVICRDNESISDYLGNEIEGELLT